MQVSCGRADWRYGAFDPTHQDPPASFERNSVLAAAYSCSWSPMSNTKPRLHIVFGTLACLLSH